MTEKLLSQEEAEEAHRLINTLRTEMNEQFEEQGLSSDPINYTTLVRAKYLSYLEEKYGVEE